MTPSHGVPRASRCCLMATLNPSPHSMPSSPRLDRRRRTNEPLNVIVSKMKVLAVIGAILSLAFPAFALDGQIQIHDPSTIVRCAGKFYTYGTGGSCLVSEDGWTWTRGTTPSRRGMAPDIIQVGDRYFMYVARNVGAQPRADINLIWSKSLDPNSPDYKWEESGVVVSSDG